MYYIYIYIYTHIYIYIHIRALRSVRCAAATNCGARRAASGWTGCQNSLRRLGGQPEGVMTLPMQPPVLAPV